MADYSGSFSGSFQGTISGSLLGSGIISSSTQIDALFNIDGLISSSAQIAKLGVGIVSGSTQIAALGVGIVSGSTQIDFNSIVNKPTTIQPFQTNAIISNNRFREVTYPAISASTSTRFTTIESSISTLSGQVQAAVSGTVPPGTISGSTQITTLGFVNSTQTSSMSVLSALTASFISSTFISASAAASGFGTALFPSGLLSSSFQIASNISGAFTSISSSFQNRISSLEVGGSSIFKLTGSFFSTTNNIQITGSLSISSGSFKSFEVNSDGFVVLGDTNVVNKDLNNAPIGTIAYSASSFYLIS